MSLVNFVIRDTTTLNEGKVVPTKVRFPENLQVIGIVRNDFDVNEKGERQVSDDLFPLVHIGDVNHLTGQILTLVEATIADQAQRKAAKDLFKQTIWNWYTSMGDNIARPWYAEKNNK